MRHAGFVLVGGTSSRMGQDKALLPFRGTTLAGYAAQLVEDAAGSATLVGDPRLYGPLGYPVIQDTMPGAGPLGGIATALGASPADWNLIVACDMPGLTAKLLRALIEQAESDVGDCLVPHGASGCPEPLCAVYHRRCFGVIARALQCGVRKVTDGLAGLRVVEPSLEASGLFVNINTPQDWIPYSNA